MENTETATATHCTRCGDQTYTTSEGLAHGVAGVWHRKACGYGHALWNATHGDPTPPVLTDEQCAAIRKNVY
tara:strand:+ start:260 stop:475 length:216 start_codon:yes stop_codon:yes gene_type:complete